ncbi:MAG: hypothetical protein ABI231_04585 [Candidatus Tumulicola sp.]
MHALRSAIAALTVATIACAVANAYPSALSLKLYGQNRRGETGTVTLQQVHGGVKVVIKMVGAGNGAKPVHIHEGTCEKLTPAPKYPLTDIVNGSSTTTIPGIILADLLGGKYAIDVHRGADLKTYVACADIAMPNTP